MTRTHSLRILVLLVPLALLALSGCLGQDKTPTPAAAAADTSSSGGEDRLAALYAAHREADASTPRKACSEEEAFLWSLGDSLPGTDGTATFTVAPQTEFLHIAFSGARGDALYAGSWTTTLTAPDGATILSRARVFSMEADPQGAETDAWTGAILRPTPGTYTFSWEAMGHIERMDLTAHTTTCQ